jgi:hypothetical protein
MLKKPAEAPAKTPRIRSHGAVPSLLSTHCPAKSPSRMQPASSKPAPANAAGDVPFTRPPFAEAPSRPMARRKVPACEIFRKQTGLDSRMHAEDLSGLHGKYALCYDLRRVMCLDDLRKC